MKRVRNCAVILGLVLLGCNAPRHSDISDYYAMQRYSDKCQASEEWQRSMNELETLVHQLESDGSEPKPHGLRSLYEGSLEFMYDIEISIRAYEERALPPDSPLSEPFKKSIRRNVREYLLWQSTVKGEVKLMKTIHAVHWRDSKLLPTINQKLDERRKALSRRLYIIDPELADDFREIFTYKESIAKK